MIEPADILRRSRSRPGREVEVILCPDGPILLRGADTVRDEDGRTVPVERPVVAVCRCGKSSSRPWCDGTHKVLRRR
ncbi:MAG: CDGSH iron-sulfur domain-containing protein [Nocardioidaceae bacterium]